MPTRLIRESCRTSPSLDGLSDFAERLFWRLITVADDHGRFDGHPAVISSLCFPLRQGQLPRIRRALAELESSDLIRCYEIERRRYGWFPTWQKFQRTRQAPSKFPAPPAANCGELPQPAANCGELPQPAANCGELPQPAANCGELPPSFVNVSINKKRSSSSSSSSFAQAFAQFWHNYPKKVGRKAAETAFRRLGPLPPMQAMLAALAVQVQSRQWQDPQFIPHPASWLNGQRWEDEPARDGRAAVAGEVAPASAPLSEAQRERLRQLTDSVGK